MVIRQCSTGRRLRGSSTRTARCSFAGVGVFQNTPSTSMVGSALDNTGLPSAVQQLMCIGGATPAPDWNGYAENPTTVPSTCADGTTGSVFANSAPNVSLFADDYSAPRSLRSNLQWSGPILGNRFSATVEGTYSANYNQASTIDLNFNPTARFTLPGEDGRPVFVNPTSIVPTTGAASTVDARVSIATLGSGAASDLASRSRQLSFRLSPAAFNQSFSWGLSYVYSNVREQFRGFSSTTGNPLLVEWGRSSFDSRHQLVYNLGYNFFDFVRVNWFGQLRSGSPYTPMVAGDINGDGYANDRAFIPSLSDADPALGASVQSLLDNTSDEARSCLQRQLGTLAARNSCQSPWMQSASMSLSFNPLKVKMPQRATLSFQVSNPLGAADLLFNGSNNLKGWGQPSFPDQQSSMCAGRSGIASISTRSTSASGRRTSRRVSEFPSHLPAMMRFDVGPTREKQMLTQQRDRGRAVRERRPGVMLKAMYGNGRRQPSVDDSGEQDSPEAHRPAGRQSRNTQSCLHDSQRSALVSPREEFAALSRWLRS